MHSVMCANYRTTYVRHYILQSQTIPSQLKKGEGRGWMDGRRCLYKAGTLSLITGCLLGKDPHCACDYPPCHLQHTVWKHMPTCTEQPSHSVWSVHPHLYIVAYTKRRLFGTCRRMLSDIVLKLTWGVLCLERALNYNQYRMTPITTLH